MRNGDREAGGRVRKFNTDARRLQEYALQKTGLAAAEAGR